MAKITHYIKIKVYIIPEKIYTILVLTFKLQIKLILNIIIPVKKLCQISIGGSINIFKKDNSNTYKKVANIPTRSGARTSLLIPTLQTYILAERANGVKSGALVVYKCK